MSWIDDILNKPSGMTTKEKMKDGIREAVKGYRALGWDEEDISIVLIGQIEEKLGKAMGELMAKWLWEINNEESGVQVQ